jgi:hypothetical protein
VGYQLWENQNDRSECKMSPLCIYMDSDKPPASGFISPETLKVNRRRRCRVVGFMIAIDLVVYKQPTQN